MEYFIKDVFSEIQELNPRYPNVFEKEVDDFDDGGSFILHFRIDSESEISKEQRQALYDAVDRWFGGRCGHDFDCCGCRFLSRQSIVVSRGDLYLHVTFGRDV
jgi:hypothetical protein